MATDTLRVGIISANWGAQSHLPAWRLLDGVEVVAMCTSRQETAEAAAAKYDIARPFWDYEAMCADPDIDIIDCGTSPLLREKMVAAALAGGKHVVNQIPFAASVEAAERLVATQREKGLKGMAAASMVGLPHVAMIKDMIADGFVGEVFQVHCHWQLSHYLPTIPGFPYHWFGKAGLGVSVTRNQGSHVLHLLRHLFGPFAAVVGRMETMLNGWETAPGEWQDNETDDTVNALIRFVDGPMCMMSTSWVAVDSPGFVLDILGSKGRLRLDALRYPGARTAKIYAAEPKPGMQPAGSEIPLDPRYLEVGGVTIDPWAAEDPSAGEQLPSVTRMFGALVDAIRNGGEPMASFSRALEVQRAVEALYMSHQNQAWVELTHG